MIQLDQVTKLYKTVIGVNDISLDLKPGTYGLLGPNGSGKTTLINLILGQLRPTLGRVRLFGKDPWSRDGLLRNVGLCPASEVLYPRITGYQWVKYLVRMHGFGAAEATKRAKEALDLVKLGDAMYRPMRGYSLGMRQRAKLAQAIAHEPELLILDEPFNGLDPVGRMEMTDYLQEWGKQGRSLILASHILHEVEAVNPSFLLISGGRMLASGSPEQVRSILVNTPDTIRIQTDQARKMASLMVGWEEIHGVTIVAADRGDAGDTVRIETRNAGQVYRLLPDLIQENGLKVYEIKSSDESLASLFGTLMKIHRGETHEGNLK